MLNYRRRRQSSKTEEKTEEVVEPSNTEEESYVKILVFWGKPNVSRYSTRIWPCPADGHARSTAIYDPRNAFSQPATRRYGGRTGPNDDLAMRTADAVRQDFEKRDTVVYLAP